LEPTTEQLDVDEFGDELIEPNQVPATREGTKEVIENKRIKANKKTKFNHPQ